MLCKAPLRVKRCQDICPDICSWSRLSSVKPFVSFFGLVVGLSLLLSACRDMNERVADTTSERFTVLSTAEIYPSNELEIIAPVFTLSGNGTLVQVVENSTEIIQVKAQDKVGSQLVYRLEGGADIEHFVIDKENGSLRFKEPPNWDNPTDSDRDNYYNVLWQVISSSGSTRSQYMVVRVVNQVESPP